MKGPLDPLEGLTEEEKQNKMDKVRDLDLSPKEERDLIWIALKTILPPVVLILLALYLLLSLVF